MIVRAGGRDDVRQVLALWRESREWTGTTDDPAGLTALVAHDPRALLVAERDGRIVGSLIAAWDGWRGNMYRLTVHPSYRRQGIARRLVVAGEERLHAVGARRISALVWSEGDRAVDVWAAAGYEHDRGVGRFVKTLR